MRDLSALPDAKQGPLCDPKSKCYGSVVLGGNLSGKSKARYAGSSQMDTITIILMIAQLAVAIYAVWKSSKKS